MSARRVKRDPSRRWRRVAAFSAVFVAVVLAVFVWTLFTGAPDESDPDTSSGGTTSTIPRPTGPRVLDAGAEPRQVLRLDFTEGEEVSFQMVVDLDVTQTSDGREQRADSPAIIQAMTMTVDRVHADGSEADVSFEVTAAAVYPEDRFSQETIDELNGDLASLVGLGGSGRMTDSGEVLTFDYRHEGDDPIVAGVLDQMAGQVATLTPSFPTEPLGVGARWEVETAAHLSGITFSQVTTYELTDITDGAVEFTSTVDQSAEPQDLDLPDADHARLLSYSGSGVGSGLFTLSSLVASGSTSMTGTQVIALTPSGGSAVEVTQELALEVVVDVIW